jgi:hypothetical protein
MQKVKYLLIKDLVLWTENPRDRIDEDADDQAIVDLALSDRSQRWELAKLAKQMRQRYDFSEIPTVVYHGRKPVVYDGNRRIILCKLKLGYVTANANFSFRLPSFPDKLPCNVCEKKVALENILRKHGDSGSWKPLERDIFLHKHLGYEKSTFLKLEEFTKMISNHPHLNQGYVKDEIFRDDVLERIGFSLKGDTLKSAHSKEEAIAILDDISDKIKSKKITTRESRGKLEAVLNSDTLKIIKKNKQNKKKQLDLSSEDDNFDSSGKLRQAPKSKQPKLFIFGGTLYLKKSNANDLYRDIAELYQYYLSYRKSVSSSFFNIIRMALRLLAEVAANEKQTKMDRYLANHFDQAKSMMTTDHKTHLSNHNVAKSNIVQLLQTGAHNYTASTNIDQTIGISLILGKMLQITHSKAGKP